MGMDGAAVAGSVFGFVLGQQSGKGGIGIGIDQHHAAFVPFGVAQGHLAQVGKAHRQFIADAVDHYGCIGAPGGALDAAGEGQRQRVEFGGGSTDIGSFKHALKR